MGITDISNKPIQFRRAIAKGFIRLNPETLKEIKNKTIKKGDPITVAETAALFAVKQTPQLIPHCHPIPIQSVEVLFDISDLGIGVSIEVCSKGSTGVEIEAITGVSIALCTLWDMVKYLEKDTMGQYPHTSIQFIEVEKKEKSYG